MSLGPLGLVLSALVLGTLVWVLTDYGILDPDRPSLLAWISLIIIDHTGYRPLLVAVAHPHDRSGRGRLKFSGAPAAETISTKDLILPCFNRMLLRALTIWLLLLILAVLNGAVREAFIRHDSANRQGTSQAR